MPIYEYRCCACDAQFETLVRGGEPVVCPSCGSTALDKLVSAPFVSTGRTARPAGQTCCGRDERCDRPPCSDAGTCRHD